jgi:hypothetical protein
MSEQKPSRPLISEDWLAVIVGFVLIFLTWIGLWGGLIPVRW